MASDRRPTPGRQAPPGHESQWVSGGFGRNIGFGKNHEGSAFAEGLQLDASARSRVWRRLSADVAPRPRLMTGTARWALRLAGAAVIFGGGMLVGRGLESGRFGHVSLVAEPLVRPASLDVALPTALIPQPAPAGSWADRGESFDRAPFVRRGPRRHISGAAKNVATVEPSVPSAPSASSPVDAEVAGPQMAIEPPQWQRLANRGEYEASLFELGQRGGFEEELARVNAEQLMLLVDVARATGQTQRALAALRRIVSEFPEEPVAPLAAWSLANLLEKAGDTAGAERAFAAYSQLSPEGDFAEDALIRQVRTAVERRDVGLAQKLVAQYEAAFPEGESAGDIREWLSTLVAASSFAMDAGVPAAPAPELSADEPTGAERDPSVPFAGAAGR